MKLKDLTRYLLTAGHPNDGVSLFFYDSEHNPIEIVLSSSTRDEQAFLDNNSAVDIYFEERNKNEKA